jgi:hypothetical protein
MDIPRRILVAALALSAARPAASAVLVEPGVTDDGAVTPRWSGLLRERLPLEEHARAAALRRPLSGPERAWLALLASRADSWERERPALERPFRPERPPTDVSVVAGNRAAPGDDAFTHDAATIGFDLGELHAAYGDASLPENAARLDRFFRHEYTHLLQRAWLTAHPWDADTPLAAALLEIWKEGLGNLHSLSARWHPVDGVASTAAAEARAALEPRFVARLGALACATPEQAARLTADLSRGRFDRKWGALPVALWLASETGESEASRRAFVEAGPAGVWDLAGRHLPPPLAAALQEVRPLGSRCGTARQ